MKEEKGKWEKIIRSKLYDFEADVNPDDWDFIAGRLPGKSVGLHFYRRYSAVAAAAVAVLLIAVGIWFYSTPDSGRDMIAVTEQPDLAPVVDEPVRSMVEKNTPAVTETVADVVTDPEKPDENSLPTFGRHPEKTDPEQRDTPSTKPLPVRLRPLEVDESEHIEPEWIPFEEPLMADASAGKKKSRRWGFGMGGGSYSMASGSNSTAPVVLSSVRLRNESLLQEVINPNGNSPNPELVSDMDHSGKELNTYSYKVPSGKVEHKAPVSAGLGISCFLNDRWSLQSGVTYTFLRSEWTSDHLADNFAEYKQHLHFIGIPLSVSYQIAEWNRFQFYASAGGMYEFNVAGKYKETIFSENLEKTSFENLHMEEPMWSVNTRAGVSYPLWRFIYAYAEAGASYYFDNQSDIETIRSDKPFNVSLQAGIRFGF